MSSSQGSLTQNLCKICSSKLVDALSSTFDAYERWVILSSHMPVSSAEKFLIYEILEIARMARGRAEKTKPGVTCSKYRPAGWIRGFWQHVWFRMDRSAIAGQQGYGQSGSILEANQFGMNNDEWFSKHLRHVYNSLFCCQSFCVFWINRRLKMMLLKVD